MDKELMKNGSGYFDPTAYEACKNVNREMVDNFERDRVYKFHRLLDMIHDLCRLCDFEIEEHIILKDKITGKVWR